MNIFAAIGKALMSVGRLLRKAWELAEDQGLSDEVLAMAMKLTEEAMQRYVPASEEIDSDINALRRNYVAYELAAKFKIPESTARVATELGLKLLKHAIKSRAK